MLRRDMRACRMDRCDAGRRHRAGGARRILPPRLREGRTNRQQIRPVRCRGGPDEAFAWTTKAPWLCLISWSPGKRCYATARTDRRAGCSAARWTAPAFGKKCPRPDCGGPGDSRQKGGRPSRRRDSPSDSACPRRSCFHGRYNVGKLQAGKPAGSSVMDISQAFDAGFRFVPTLLHSMESIMWRCRSPIDAVLLLPASIIAGADIARRAWETLCRRVGS